MAVTSCLPLPYQPFEAGDLLTPETPGLLITGHLAPRLVAGNVIGKLLDDGEKPGKGRQARVRRGMDLLSLRRAGGNQRGIDLVVLGPLQLIFGIGPYLGGLKHDDHEAVAAKRGHDGLFVATTRLDADAFDAALAQPRHQLSMSFTIIVDLQPIGALIESHIEFTFAGIDTGTDHGMSAHLRRPFLVMRTLGSFNHPGLDEEPAAILLRNSPSGLWRRRSDDRRPGPGGRPGRADPHGTPPH